MMLLTEEIKNALPPLYSTEETPIAEKTVVCKFFNPMGRGTWYVVEGEKREDGDWLFFGVAHIHEPEWGYFTLSQLENVQIHVSHLGLGLGIERDINFRPRKIKSLPESVLDCFSISN
jgi:hypothetical protein